MARARLLVAIAVLAGTGILVSSISLHHHYAKSKTSYCDIGDNFNCDIVNRSRYSTVLGVPVAGIGIAGYLTLFTLSTFCRQKRDTPILVLAASLAGLAFALYLTYIERFVLATWCVLCLSSLFLIFTIALLSSLLVMRIERERPS